MLPFITGLRASRLEASRVIRPNGVHVMRFGFLAQTFRNKFLASKLSPLDNNDDEAGDSRPIVRIIGS